MYFVCFWLCGVRYVNVQTARKVKGRRNVVLRGGKFYLQKPVILTEKDSWLTITNYDGENAIVSGKYRKDKHVVFFLYFDF